ncbi:MAG: hypothetical protein ACXVIJ_07350, partial [Thermoanaerobaculia bacterium]
MKTGQKHQRRETWPSRFFSIFNFQFSIVLAISATLVAPTAFAWGEKGHFISSEAATLTLPTDMPPFFYKAFPDLIWLGDDPDRWRNAGESLENVNPPDHYIDFEYVAALDLPPQRYRFIDQLYTTHTLRRYGVSATTIGFLPWRIAELCDRLTAEWRLWRTASPQSPDRRFLEADIIHDAGTLGHYVEDAANPLHTTFNHNGWLMRNPNGYANDCLIHARFETYFVTLAISTPDVVARIPTEQLRTDYFATALGFVKRSNTLVETVYRI